MTTEHEPPPPGAGFMNAFRWVLFAGLLLLAVVGISAYLFSRGTEGRVTAAAKAARYRCPMHPSYTSDRPGECPICSMTLEPIPAGPAGSDSARGEANAADGNVPGLASVQISPERIQLIGVRTARVVRRAIGSRLDLVGFVVPDERSLRLVRLRVSGWVRKLNVNQTGEWIRAGQPLLTIYSPELYQSEQEYLIERRAATDGSESSHEVGAAQAGRDRLRLLGVPETEIARLDREGTASTEIVLPAPVTGTVLERNVTEGAFVGADTPLLTIADLSRVWVLADLYEMDFGRVRTGDRTEFRVDAIPDRRFEGRVEFIYPTVSSDTRTLKLRLSLSNPGGALRPGMYGRAIVHAEVRPELVVPAEAVVNAGEHDYAFLARAGGRFEPRMISVGRGDGEWIPVLRGLAEGDTVVASASFLIDSESRLRAAITGMGRTAGAASAGHDHGGTP
ncbi:MAG: efflux RND transporter periplasmic adaptor subunit [Candidatus Eisenbacteria bacterium]